MMHQFPTRGTQTRAVSFNIYLPKYQRDVGRWSDTAKLLNRKMFLAINKAKNLLVKFPWGKHQPRHQPHH